MAVSLSPSPSSSLTTVGAMLDGRYRIDEVIGTGGMGRVYRGEHVGIRRPVAIKVLLPELGRSRAIAEQFQREAFASGQLDHPNIVGVSDFGLLADGTMFLVMEILEGESLAARLLRDGRVPWMDAIEIMRGVLAGMQYAHDRDIVHCDLKPDNLFIARKHGEDLVKILDFGIARLVATTDDTDTGNMTIGTPSYLSPEQAVGAAITPASDLYSVSVVFYELLCGHVPFRDTSASAKLLAHVHREPPRFDPELGIPPALEEIVRCGLAKSPSQRVASATEYQERLDQVLMATGIAVPRTRSALISGAIRAVSLADGSGESQPIPRARTEPPLRARTEPPVIAKTVMTRQHRWLRRAAIATALCALAGGGIYAATRGASPAIAQPAPAPAPTPVIAATPVAPPVHEAPTDPLFEHAREAIAAGKVTLPAGDNALELITELERAHPGDPRVAELRAHAAGALRGSAETLWDHDKKDSARTLYRELLRVAPDDAVARERTRVIVPSAPAVRVVAAARPDAARVGWLVSQIELAIIERRFVAPSGHNALEYLLQLRKLDPSDEAVRRLGSEVATALSKAADAAPADAPQLRAAAKQANEPTPAASHASGSGAGSAAGSGAGSADDARRDPDQAAQWVAKGKGLAASGDFAGATAAYQHAIGADSASHAALAGLADVAFNQGDFTRAVLSAKRAVSIAPRVVAYRMTLAKSYFKLLRYADAIAQWQHVLDMDPSNASARKNLELARAKLK